MLSSVWPQCALARISTGVVYPVIRSLAITNGHIILKGGLPPYSWSLLSGAMPSGLQLNTSSGVISGTPAVGAARKNSSVRRPLKSASAGCPARARRPWWQPSRTATAQTSLFLMTRIAEGAPRSPL
ncbi:MAG: putative Ig domain-containing protein [Phycisphaerae bacterium]|nr:putative Ig domain-containing protein [Phycisphaerae bacterium]